MMGDRERDILGDDSRWLQAAITGVGGFFDV